MFMNTKQTTEGNWKKRAQVRKNIVNLKFTYDKW
jgi:hypothetical protein